MAGGGTNGLMAALQAIGAAGVAPGGEGGQADMFEASDAPLPLGPAKGRSGPQGGRPLGARNKSTDEWCRYLLSQYRSPLTGLAELYSRPLEELVADLQAIANKTPKAVWFEGEKVGEEVVFINPLDVLRLQMQAKAALAPYVHKQQPKAIEVDSKPRGVVLLGDIVDAETEASDDLALPLPPIEQNQAVSAAPAAQSDEPQSDMPANALIYRG